MSLGESTSSAVPNLFFRVYHTTSLAKCSNGNPQYTLSKKS